MSLSAHTNAPGEFARYKAYTYQYRRGGPDGYDWSEVRYFPDAVSKKSAPVSSPVRLLSGSSTPFRQPTSYIRAVRKEGLKFVDLNVYYGETRTDTYKISSREVLGNGPSTVYCGLPFPDTNMNPAWSSNDLNRAQTECLLKLGEKKADLGAALAEAKKTAQSLAGLAITAVRTLRSARRGNWGAAMRELGFSSGGRRSYSGNYLEWVYGIKPLYEDIYGTVGLLSDQLKVPALLLHAKRTIKDSDKFSGSYRGGWPSEYQDVQYEGSYEAYTTCDLWGRIRNPYLHAVQQAGLVNPLTVVWEVVPYSFLVDWVLPVGPMLDALTATAGIEFVGGYVSRRAQGKALHRCSPRPFPYSGGDVEVNVERFAFERRALGDFPKAMPYVKSPFSTDHVFNAIALLRQLTR